MITLSRLGAMVVAGALYGCAAAPGAGDKFNVRLTGGPQNAGQVDGVHVAAIGEEVVPVRVHRIGIALVADRRQQQPVVAAAGRVAPCHAAALRAGGRDNGKPGLRADYGPHYYAAFVVDPDGYRLEAYCGEKA